MTLRPSQGMVAHAFKQGINDFVFGFSRCGIGVCKRVFVQ